MNAISIVFDHYRNCCVGACNVFFITILLATTLVGCTQTDTPYQVWVDSQKVCEPHAGVDFITDTVWYHGNTVADYKVRCVNGTDIQRRINVK